MSEALLITPALGSAVVTAADTARVTRDELLHAAALVTTVGDRIDADDATAVLKKLKDFSREIEAQRMTAKAPALDIGRKIDALAKDIVAAVDAEAGRISRVLGAFEAEERRKAEEARRAADAEAARIAAEALRKSAAVRREAGDTLSGERAADSVVEQAQQQIIAVKQAAANAAPLRTTGTQVREDICFEVTDIRELYADSPHLVKLEPNGTAIRAILRDNPNLQLPGLRHWREAKLNVR